MGCKCFFEKHTLKCVAGGFIAALACVGLMSGMMSATGSPEFCGSCHSMKSEAATFSESSHRYQECTECHLPHDNIVTYLFAKGQTGMTDMYHEVMRDYPANIKLDKDSRELVNKNCYRCHKGTVASVHKGVTGGDAGDCLKCHSRIAHGSNHLEGGIKVE